MPRSLKKGPFVHKSLLKEFKKIWIQIRKMLLKHGPDPR